MKTKKSVLLVLMSLLATATSFSAFAQQDGVFVGLGGLRCAEYVKHAQDPTSQDLVGAWVQGYLVGVNIGQSNESGVREVPKPEVVTGYIFAFCRDNPGKSIASAANSLRRLQPKISLQ